MFFFFSLDLGHKPTLNPFITIKVGYRQADFSERLSAQTFLILCLIGYPCIPAKAPLLFSLSKATYTPTANKYELAYGGELY